MKILNVALISIILCFITSCSDGDSLQINESDFIGIWKFDTSLQISDNSTITQHLVEYDLMSNGEYGINSNFTEFSSTSFFSFPRVIGNWVFEQDLNRIKFYTELESVVLDHQTIYWDIITLDDNYLEVVVKDNNGDYLQDQILIK